MTNSQTNSFERVFPWRNLFRGSALMVLGLSILSSLLLIVQLILVSLTADLLETRGILKLPPSDVPELARILGEAPADADAPQPDRIRPDSNGLIAGVWRTRNLPWGPMVASAYQRIPALSNNEQALAALAGGLVLFGLLRSLTLSRCRRASAAAAMEVATGLRRSLHRQSLRLEPSVLDGEAAERGPRMFIDDVETIRESVGRWVGVLNRAPVELLLLLLFALMLNPLLTLQTLIPLGLCWYLVQRVKASAAESRRRDDERTAAGLRLLAEGLRKSRLVRGYGMDTYEQEQFQTHLERYQQNADTIERGRRKSRWVTRVLVMLCATLVLFLVGYKVLSPTDGFTLADALVLTVTVGFMLPPLQALWSLQEARSRAAIAADRIYRYLNEIPEVGQAVGARFLDPMSRTLQFESVTYTGSNRRKLLDGIDLKIKAGETIGIISLDPVESHALVYLLPRFIEPTSGRILIDGEDIAWVTLESLRAETVLVSGSDPCFTGSVLDNIRGGDSRFSLQDVTQAAKQSHAHHFIQRLPQGYETELGEHGEQLDAGQAFRLGLARAILRDPALLIIEEPDVTLDDDTKNLLDDAYNRILPGRTVLFIPSRMSTLRRTNRVVVLNKGRVEAVGPHSEVVRSCPLLRHWEYMHFNDFRDAMGSTA